MLPKISIITPSYNQAQYLEQTMDSVLSQAYPNLEYIVIDGGSTDGSAELIKKYEKHLTFWVSEKDKGQTHAINKGLPKCTGDLFNWINSDDYYEKDTFKILAEAYQAHPDCHLIMGKTHCYYETSGETSHTYAMGLKSTVSESILNVEMNQPGSFYNMKVINQLGSLNESLNFVFDSEYWMRYLCANGIQKNKLVYVDEIMAHFRLHEQSKSMGEGFSDFWDEYWQIIYYLAKNASLDKTLCDKIKNQSKGENYQSKPWDIGQLELLKFESILGSKYLTTLYNEGEKALSKKYMKMAITEGQFKLNRKNFSLYIKHLLKN